jgi:two-component system cell cycle sensor histidine kinase PleC
MPSLGLWAAPEEPRFTEARLRLIIATLPSTIALNPLWTALLFVPFLYPGSAFGRVPLWHLFVALAMQLFLAALALAVYWRNRMAIRNVGALERQLLVLQTAISVCWGIVCWLFMDPGNPVNTIYVSMTFVSVIWAIVFTRLSHGPIFLAGFVPLTAIFTVVLLSTPGEVAGVFSRLLPVWTIYILLMGMRGRAAIDQTLATQFSNADLSQALRASNEEALRKRYEAEAANSAKTNFLANMSHELRTPLNAILGFSDIIAQQTLGPDARARYAEYAADIHASGSHLLSLINDLLDVAKIEAGKMEIDPQLLDLPQVMAGIERLMAPRARARRQTMRYVVEPGLPALLADERAVKQIALNLISNAVKFTPEKGRIEVSCRRASEGGIVIEVSDNGPGIAPEKIERVFQPFSQIDNRYGRQSGGTGLGLALVKGLAELHGGHARIESQLGRGTRVSVYFPLAMESPVPAAVASR